MSWTKLKTTTIRLILMNLKVVAKAHGAHPQEVEMDLEEVPFHQT
jgi:hypothetical protein